VPSRHSWALKAKVTPGSSAQSEGGRLQVFDARGSLMMKCNL
jgi:hypothetical protein